MNRPHLVRHLPALIVCLGIIASACGPTTPEEALGEVGLRTALTDPCQSPPGPCYQDVGAWNPSLGRCVYFPKAAGTACDDGRGCTDNDVCDGAGTCAGTSTCVPQGYCQDAYCWRDQCMYVDIPCSPPPGGDAD